MGLLWEYQLTSMQFYSIELPPYCRGVPCCFRESSMGIPCNFMVSMVPLWRLNGVPMGLPCFLHDTPCHRTIVPWVVLFCFHSAPVGLSLYPHGTPIYCGTSVELPTGPPWDPHGTSIGLPWDSHGTSMGVQCFDVAIMGPPWPFHWTHDTPQRTCMGPMGLP